MENEPLEAKISYLNKMNILCVSQNQEVVYEKMIETVQALLSYS